MNHTCNLSERIVLIIYKVEHICNPKIIFQLQRSYCLIISFCNSQLYFSLDYKSRQKIVFTFYLSKKLWSLDKLIREVRLHNKCWDSCISWAELYIELEAVIRRKILTWGLLLANSNFCIFFQLRLNLISSFIKYGLPFCSGLSLSISCFFFFLQKSKFEWFICLILRTIILFFAKIHPFYYKNFLLSFKIVSTCFLFIFILIFFCNNSIS